MKIWFKCSGGYANFNMSYYADTDTLPLCLSENLAQQVHNSGILELHQDANSLDKHASPDVFDYQLNIEHEGKPLCFLFNDITVPTEVHPLLALLREWSFDQRKVNRV